jgi:hypothetical protein
MIGYAEREVFSAREKHLFRMATMLVSRVPYALDGQPVRCHELARAVGRVLELTHEDGRFGFVEHTWLWTEPKDHPKFAAPWVLPNVLDVYVPGSMPQVQLVHMATGLPSRYYLSNLSFGIPDDRVVEELVRILKIQSEPAILCDV